MSLQEVLEQVKKLDDMLKEYNSDKPSGNPRRILMINLDDNEDPSVLIRDYVTKENADEINDLGYASICTKIISGVRCRSRH